MGDIPSRFHRDVSGAANKGKSSSTLLHEAEVAYGFLVHLPPRTFPCNQTAEGSPMSHHLSSSHQTSPNAYSTTSHRLGILNLQICRPLLAACSLILLRWHAHLNESSPSSYDPPFLFTRLEQSCFHMTTSCPSLSDYHADKKPEKPRIGPAGRTVTVVTATLIVAGDVNPGR